MKFKTFIIDTITNMHVGSGEASFGIVDNHIQRDPVTSVPMINSSGIKGALRDQIVLEKDNDLAFGQEHVKETGKTQPGQLIFMDAKLLAVPLRSSENVFFYSTSRKTILDFLDTMELIGILTSDTTRNLRSALDSLNFSPVKPFILPAVEVQNTAQRREVEIEDFTVQLEVGPAVSLPDFENLFLLPLGIRKSDIAIFSDDAFKLICESHMPVIARNCIDNDTGTSQNLFYEEVLPRKSKLYFSVGYDEKKHLELMTSFEQKLTVSAVQFGANYSIGYGFSEIRSYTGGNK